MTLFYKKSIESFDYSKKSSTFAPESALEGSVSSSKRVDFRHIENPNRSLDSVNVIK